MSEEDKKHMKSTELLSQQLTYVETRLVAIEKKLDEKFVSHETFDLTVKSINSAVSLVVKAGLFLAVPIYGAVITLVFKTFTS